QLAEGGAVDRGRWRAGDSREERSRLRARLDVGGRAVGVPVAALGQAARACRLRDCDPAGESGAAHHEGERHAVGGCVAGELEGRGMSAALSKVLIRETPIDWDRYVLTEEDTQRFVDPRTLVASISDVLHGRGARQGATLPWNGLRDKVRLPGGHV